MAQDDRHHLKHRVQQVTPIFPIPFPSIFPIFSIPASNSSIQMTTKYLQDTPLNHKILWKRDIKRIKANEIKEEFYHSFSTQMFSVSYFNLALEYQGEQGVGWNGVHYRPHMGPWGVICFRIQQTNNSVTPRHSKKYQSFYYCKILEIILPGKSPPNKVQINNFR